MDEHLPRDVYDLLTEVCAAFPDSVPAGHVLCAVSGGSDSVALLELLTLARDRYDVSLSAAYVDHRVRAEAALECEHVRSLAAARGVAFHAARIDDPGRADEARLRLLRYRHLQQIAARIGADWIATGHTRDDQIETILFRLFRGSGRRGLAGIPPSGPNLLRPLLRIDRRRLREFLASRAIEWREDASNEDSRYTRNRIRHELRPAIERTLGSAGLARLPLLADRWREEERYLEQQAGRWRAWAVRESRAYGVVIDIVALREVPAALRSRVLRAWLREAAGGREPGVSGLEVLERLAAGTARTTTVDIAGLRVARSANVILIDGCAEPPEIAEREISTQTPDVLVGPAATWSIRVDPRPEGEPRARETPWREEIDLDRVGLPQTLRVRPVTPSDIVHDTAHAARPVAALLREARVPAPARPTWPVLVDRGTVVWVPGTGLADLRTGSRTADRAQRPVRFAWHRRHL